MSKLDNEAQHLREDEHRHFGTSEVSPGGDRGRAPGGNLPPYPNVIHWDL